MPDPRFFQRAGPFRVREIAAWTGATAPGQQDLDRAISDVGDLKSATSDDLAYFAGAEHAAAANASQCGACLTTESLSAKAPAGAVVLIVDDPQAAFSIAAHPPSTIRSAIETFLPSVCASLKAFCTPSILAKTPGK